MHIKVTSPSDWKLGVKSAELVRHSSRGLVGDDLNTFIKRAGHAFDSQLGNIKIEKDEIPVHLIALGTTEAYGPNRNGDGFKAATCRKMHDTFVKNARWFRNHKNKDPSISYGIIKASAFNEEMQRVELLVALNAAESAAKRNGGFVADQELEKIARGEDLPVSMACKVAYDVCASCGNKARHREDYCTEDTCIGPRGEKRGGCKNHLTEVAHDGFINHVDNPNSDWFDISKVYNPADYIAYGGVANYLQKAASGRVLGGAALAEAWGLSPVYLGREADLWSTKSADYRLIERLAEEETAWMNPTDWHRQAARVLASQHELDLRGFKKQAALSALSAARIALSPTDFLRWQLGDEGTKLAAAVSARLPGIYGRLVADENLPQMIRENPFATSHVASEDSQRLLAKQASAEQAFTSSGFYRGSVLAMLRHGGTPAVKTASTIALPPDAQCERLARSYALYKLAFLVSLPSGPDVDLASRLVVAQNYVL